MKFYKIKKSLTDGSFEDVYHFGVEDTGEDIDQMNRINEHYATYAYANPGQYVVEQVPYLPEDGDFETAPITKKKAKAKKPE